MLVNHLGKDDPQPCNFFPEWDGEIPENGIPQSPSSPHSHSPSPFSPPKSTPPDNFKILNINPTSNKREVTVAFRTLAKVYHPDKFYDSIRQFIREEGEEKFKILSNAYEDLKKSNTLF